MKPSYNRANRQKSANARKEKYDKLTTQQKLEKHIDTVGGPQRLVGNAGVRQLDKLMARIAKENLAVVAKASAKAEKRK